MTPTRNRPLLTELTFQIASKVEQQAGAERTRDLTQDDPGPQTIFRVVVKPDAPLLVKVQLRYRAKARRKDRASR
jgi:hypothetical protein